MYGNAEEAKKLLTHYFRLIAEQAGVNWDSDNDAEIEYAVDLIIKAAAATAARKLGEGTA